MSSLIIENISKRKGAKKDMVFPLDVESKSSQIERAIVEIRKMFKKQGHVDGEYHVLLNEPIEGCRMSIRVICWVKVHGTYDDYLSTKNEINLKILKIFEKNKIKLLA